MALIETATGLVVNVIELEPEADWQPPAGHHVQDASFQAIDPVLGPRTLHGGPGDVWDGTRYIKVQIPVPPQTRRDVLRNKLKTGIPLTPLEQQEALLLALET